MAGKKHKINVETAKSQKDWSEISNKDIEKDIIDDEEGADEELGSAEPREALEHPSYEEMEEKLTVAEQKAEENWNKYLKEHAAHENTRKRLERDISSAYKYSVEKILLEFLPIIDCLEKSLEAKADGSTALTQIRDGVEMTLKMFADLLEKQGVKVIDPKGDAFDPTHHEAMTMQENGEVESNTVLEVFQKGYLLHDRLIRPARVIVSK